MARSRQLSIRSRRRSDVASILRSNDFNAEVTALKLWRQGISSLDIALAPCLSEPQKHDLIDAVDKLSNVAHLDNSSNLGNEREVIMVDDKDNAVSNEDGMEELDKDKLNSLYGAIPVTITLKDCYGNVITKATVMNTPSGSQLVCSSECCTPSSRPEDREMVYRLIDGEREYQDNKWCNVWDDSQWSVNDWLVFIERYLYEAREQTGNDFKMMDNIRKIAALAVAAMEYNETPPRV